MGKVTPLVSARQQLVNVDFGRVNARAEDGRAVQRFDMSKKTSLGILSAFGEVPLAEVCHSGQEVIDGRMYNRLSREIHEEETRRILEGSANFEFGLEVM